MKLSLRIDAREVRARTRADAGALVAADAERLRAMARRAVGATALGFGRVHEHVVGAVKVDGLDEALMTLDALRFVVTRIARRIEAARLLFVIAGEVRAVLVAQARAHRHERAVRELGLDEATDLREVTRRALPLVGAVVVTRQAR